MATVSTTSEKYDIFLSFRGEDTRNNFTSHLHEALRSKQIETFIDDELDRGGEISSSLLKAIEQSKIHQTCGNHLGTWEFSSICQTLAINTPGKHGQVAKVEKCFD
ncbi:TIR-NBS-LRR disease resistance protein [Quillaja saponaria]|uniref:TIR-NBS-LRR disease resistance protein n=1 Tax=Quillaja saponaria TaxID=32244 RepID=A0AAD7PPB6_QUISA|nr:TIR-NBS-LRR disease resistance protein [Quillaja saponaria]